MSWWKILDLHRGVAYAKMDLWKQRKENKKWHIVNLAV